MAGFTWKIDTRNLAAIIAKLPEQAESTVDYVADPTLADIKEHAPVDTGRLQTGYYKVTTGPAARELRSGDDIEYAAPVEFGHHTRSGSWVPAQPHFVPAFDRAQNRWAEAAKQAGLFQP